MDAQPVRPTVSSHPLPQSAQWALAFLLGVAVTVAVCRFGPVLGKTRPTDHRIAAGVDLNRADKAELMQLPKTSDRRANQIMATRDERGGFDSVDDLRKVKGVGPARQEELRRSSASPITSSTSSLRRRCDKSTKKDSSGDPVDVNSASAEELQNCRASAR